MHTLFEFLAILLVLASLTLSSEFRSWLGTLPRKLQLFFASLALFMLVGHFGRSSAQSFPFVFWGMYTETVRDSNLYHIVLEGKTVGGERVPINPSKLYPSLGFGSLRINNRLHEIGRKASESTYQATQTDIELLKAIATTFHRKNKQIWLQEISLYWVVLPVQKQAQSSQVVLNVTIEN